MPQTDGEHLQLGTVAVGVHAVRVTRANAVAVGVHAVCVACANTSTLLVLMLRPHLQAGYR